MVFPEIAKAEAIQVVFMSGVAEGTVVGIVRRLDMDASTRADQPVKFFHRFDDIGYMFNDMDCPQAIEAVSFERVREPVKIRQYVRTAGRVVVQSYCPRIFIDSAANVKDQGKLMKP